MAGARQASRKETNEYKSRLRCSAYFISKIPNTHKSTLPESFLRRPTHARSDFLAVRRIKLRIFNSNASWCDLGDSGYFAVKFSKSDYFLLSHQIYLSHKKFLQHQSLKSRASRTIPGPIGVV